MQGKDGPYTFTLNLDGEPALTMVRIPAGQFIMGDPQGSADEAPCLVRIAKPFWISATEVDNGLFRRFAPEHDSGNWLINTKDMGNMGAPLNHDRQPATRLSWQRANAFCAWLSKTTGGSFALPSEAEWEWACRAGSDGAFAFGPTDADWTPFANLAGAEAIATFARDPARKDKHYATAPVGSYRPNAWGLFDMHGNVAEWTRSPYLPYPYKDSSITGSPDPNRYVVVRGGSFRDIPHNARAGYRRAYRTWHGVIDVGFRIVCEEPLPQTR
jgi:formylglycine-generating enzyme required for sulfatase activity